MSEIAKTRCISDAHIQFVSLVDKAANKKSFLIAKAEDGKASFSAYGKIVKTDSETHYVTGVVYEPMVEDAQGDCMTADEIRKAAHWFAKNGRGIDIQHNYEKFEKAEVVESWIAPADFEINKEKIKKGSWLMTVEITDQDVWSAVEKGEITGFSMGGQGVYTEEDIDLSGIDKSKGKSILKKLAKALGFDVVEKGEFADEFSHRNKNTSFWDAFYSLQEILFKYNYRTGRDEPETDPDKIKECLAEFSEVIQNVLVGDKVTVEKSLSTQNIEKLKSTYENIGNLLSEAGESEVNMTKSETEKLIKQAITEFNKADENPPEAQKPDEVTKEFVVDTVNKMLSDIKKSEEETVTEADVVEMIQKALEPIFQARGIPTNLNSETEQVQKSSEHYLHGII